MPEPVTKRRQPHPVRGGSQLACRVQIGNVSHFHLQQATFLVQLGARRKLQLAKLPAERKKFRVREPLAPRHNDQACPPRGFDRAQKEITIDNAYERLKALQRAVESESRALD